MKWAATTRRRRVPGECWWPGCDRAAQVRIVCTEYDRAYCPEHFGSIALVPPGSSVTWAPPEGAP